MRKARPLEIVETAPHPKEQFAMIWPRWRISPRAMFNSNLVNGSVVMPAFDDPHDEPPAPSSAMLFRRRQVMQIDVPLPLSKASAHPIASHATGSAASLDDFVTLAAAQFACSTISAPFAKAKAMVREGCRKGANLVRCRILLEPPPYFCQEPSPAVISALRSLRATPLNRRFASLAKERCQWFLSPPPPPAVVLERAA